MSIPETDHSAITAPRRVEVDTEQVAPSRPSERLRQAGDLVMQYLSATPAGLGSFGCTEADRDRLASHLGRQALQASRSRDFSTAWRKTTHGEKTPRLYRMGTQALGRCQYAVLTHKQYAAVVVIDVDKPGVSGGQVSDIAADVHQAVARLVAHRMGPAWIGVNPVNGRCQLIWLIDPVYAGESGESAHMHLLRATQRMLAGVVGGDPAFAHRFSRSPFYTGDDPHAYRWHVQHHQIIRVADLRQEVQTMTTTAATATDPSPTQRYSSGRELIEAVKARREQAQHARGLFSQLDSELPDAGALDGDRIDGVKVYWLAKGRAGRDETAFRHALMVAHRLREAGQRMTDAKIIDAYERAYNLAQAVGADNRQPEMPPMRDRQTMARRVRGYVLSANRSSSRAGASVSGSVDGATARERKALATMGSRGGKKAAQRWNDRNSDYAQSELKKLRKTQQRKKAKGRSTRSRISQLVNDQFIETGSVPTWKEIMEEMKISRRTVAYHMAALRSSGEIPEE